MSVGEGGLLRRRHSACISGAGAVVGVVGVVGVVDKTGMSVILEMSVASLHEVISEMSAASLREVSV